ncbi:MAG: HNH endonuclease [Actinomycetota bacterium]
MATKPPLRQLDRRGRMVQILERDGYDCVWCRRPIEVGLNRATTEHLIPRVKGGPSWLENEVAACRRCNGKRGHVSAAEWLDECERLGLNPNRGAVINTLIALRDRITAQGGNRRMRPHLDRQLRRLLR